MLRFSRRLALVLSMFAAILATIAGAEVAITPGKLTPKVAVGSYSYAVYLPTNYDARQKWPAVFVFDPMARGALAAEKFIPGAEKYGYVVAASNDSRNGPTRVDAINAMSSDVISRFNIDKPRVYLAGMSGGARVAIEIAGHCHDCPAGVLACAAGFNQQKPFEPKEMVYFGVAGLYDFNYSELFRNNESLDRTQTAHRFETFDGSHGWPPDDVLSTALAWLRLQEMARGAVPRDPHFIEARFQAEADRASQLESSAQFYPAYLAYKQFLADFGSLHGTSEILKHYNVLKDRREIKDAIKAEHRAFATQEALETPVIALMQSIVNGTAEPDTATHAVALTTQLRERVHREKDSKELIPLRRALGGVMIAAYESAVKTRSHNDMTATRKLQEIAVAANPDNPDLLYDLACLYALEGNRKAALQTLKRSIAQGFNRLELLKTDPDLESLRKEAEFQKLVGGAEKTDGKSLQ